MKPVVRGRGFGAWLFLALVLLGYAAVALLEPEVAARAWAAFTRMAASLVPVLVLVFALVFLAERFLSPGHLGHLLFR